MHRRQFLASLASAAAAPAAPRKPNIVFILADDLGWSDLGCYGSTFHETPHLDRFAASAIKFTQAYAACPVCSPTRTAIMTGKYPARVGLTDYLPGLQPRDRKLLSVEDLDGLPASEITLAQALREGGYRTFMHGKWHLGEAGPKAYGFDEATEIIPRIRDGSNRDAGLTEGAVKFLESAGDKPFFLYLPFTYPHTPVDGYKPRDEHFRKKLAGLGFPEQRLTQERNGTTRLYQDNAEYAAVVAAMDENVGAVLRAITERKLDDNTIVVFTSDNGGLSTLQNKEGGPTSNRPLRSGKGWCYEGGIRVPLIVRAPGVARAGSSSGMPVISNDHYPTLLQLAGLPARPQQHLDGVSYASVLAGKAAPKRDTLYWHYPHYHGSAWAPGAALRAGDWKLIEFYEEDKVELYNLKEDLGERKDLSAAQPGLTKKLREQLRAWQKSVGAKMAPRNSAWKG